jgi:hypothetical protein
MLSLVVSLALGNVVTLDATTESLEVTTSAAVSTDYAVSYVDNASGTVTPGSSHGNISTATTTAVLAAPGASTQRAVTAVSVCNVGTTSTQTVTVKHDTSATERVIYRAAIGPSECLTADNTGAWSVANAAGVPKGPATSEVGGRVYVWNKSATAIDTIGYHYAFFKDTGFPGAMVLGTPGLNGATLDCSTVAGGAGVIGAPIVPSTGNLYLASVTLANAVVGTYQLVDVLWYNTALVVTTTTAQTTTSPTLPARDDNGSTNGEGVQFALLTTTANTNAAAIANGAISYTDSDGNAGAAGAQFAAVGFQTTISPVIGTWTPFYLAAGDRGIRALASVTLGTSYVAGALSAVLYRPLATVGVSVANNSTVVVPPSNVRVWPGSCLAWVALGAPAVTAPLLTAATVQLVER